MGFSLTEYFKARRSALGVGSRSARRVHLRGPDTGLGVPGNAPGKLTDQMKVADRRRAESRRSRTRRCFTELIKHSVWYMADVASCFAMRDLLEAHPYFSGFEIVVAAGQQAGRGLQRSRQSRPRSPRPTKEHSSGTITLSCGKLMTGVTIREWGAILMLRSLKSPESYFQAAFRVQSPWATREARRAGRECPQADLLRVRVRSEPCPDARRRVRDAAGGSTGETTPERRIGQLLNYLPIYAFSGGAMTQLDASEVLDWATAGVGATALAQRWNSPLLVDVNERTLSALLDHPALLEALAQIEDFRASSDGAEQVVTSTKLLKKAKREQGGKLDTEQKKRAVGDRQEAQGDSREAAEAPGAKIPVFMYVTDFREEALKDVIESLDTALFERVTGLTVDDFELLNNLGLFNAQHMNAAIYQFKVFEDCQPPLRKDGGHR